MGAIESLAYFLPELILVGTVLALFMGDLLIRDKEWLGLLALVGVVASLALVAQMSRAGDAWLFNNMIVHDGFATFFKVVFALATAATTPPTIPSVIRFIAFSSFFIPIFVKCLFKSLLQK